MMKKHGGPDGKKGPKNGPNNGGDGPVKKGGKPGNE